MVKVIPSPDWFVGVDSLNLCEAGQWKEEMTFDLHPFDAGTDSGFTFSSPNFPTMPPENITMVRRSLKLGHYTEKNMLHHLKPDILITPVKAIART